MTMVRWTCGESLRYDLLVLLISRDVEKHLFFKTNDFNLNDF